MRRRDFLKAAGASGLFIFIPGSPLMAVQEPEQLPERPEYPSDFNAYLRIGGDGRVGCFVGKVELGQGNMTALAMILAEELEVDLDQVDMLMGDTDLCPWDMGTWGSLSIWQFGPVLRGAAAEGRAVLLQMAGERLQEPADRLAVKSGVVSVQGAPSRQVTYAQLVQGRRIERHLADVKPKPVSAYTIVGRPAPRKDALAKVTGSARYAADMGFPGTLHACILRPPAHGAALKAVDVSAAERMAGARVVREGDFVAVLHERPDLARTALGLVQASWDVPEPAFDDRTVYRHLVATAPAAKVVARKGDPRAGEKLAATLAEAEYRNAYVAHAPIETHSAVARLEGGKMTVWCGAQAPFLVKAQVAQALGLQPRKVRVITPYVGGGFGGKSAGPHGVEAARLAKATGRTVQVVWDRREEIFLDTFRPAAVVRIRSGLDPAGRISFWDHQVFAAGEREADTPYDIPHKLVRSAGSPGDGTPGLHLFGTGPWRAPSANTNVFARESHMDLMASRAKVDPVAFRLRHLSAPRMVRVLETVARAFGWTPAPAPSGRGLGVACAVYRDTTVAVMAEVAVDRGTGQVRVKRVAMAVDMGLVVNPDGARQQIEGAITMGLGYALTEGLRFQGGRILDENFDTYQLPRFSWLPRIETILVPNPELAALGCGEPPICCMGAVIANAIHDAAGVRLLELPMTPERVLQALKLG